MGFKKALLEKVIEPHSSQKVTNSIGKILSYDSYLNRANVLVSSSGAFNTLKDVPVQLSGTGIMSAMPQEGDLVYIQYNNGSVFQPKVVGIADEDYQNKTRENSKHMRKGTLLRNIVEREGEIVPRAKRRMDTSNDPFKHFDYREADASEILESKTEDMGFFSGRELGLFHPILSSLVKLKDNGDIDIFTGTNTGIRVSRKNKTVEMFGDVSTNSQNWKVLSNSVTVISDDVDIECKRLKLKADDINVNGEKLNV